MPSGTPIGPVDMLPLACHAIGSVPAAFYCMGETRSAPDAK